MNNNFAFAVEYIKIDPKDFENYNLDNAEQLSDFKSQIILKTQGQAVELSENMPIDKLVLCFALSYEICSEAVLRLNNKELILIFSHHEKTFLRREKINQEILLEIEKAREKAEFVSDIAMPNPEFVVNLKKEWNKIKKQKDIILQTKEFIKIMPEILKPTLNLVFEGEIPVLPLLCLIYFSRSYSYNIYYKNKNNRIKLF